LELADLGGHGWPLLAIDENEIAFTAFDHLGFDGLEPSACVRAILDHSVNQNSAIASFALPLSQIRPAPFPLHDPLIFAIGSLASEAAPLFPGYPDCAVPDSEDVFGILVLILLKPGVPSVEVFSVEQRDGFRRCNSFRRRLRQQRHSQQNQGEEWHGAMVAE